MLRKSRLFFASIVMTVAAVSLVLGFGGVLTASGASSGGKVIVPSPPGQPTLAPTITTKTTTRIYGRIPSRSQCRSLSTSGRRCYPAARRAFPTVRGP